MIRRKQTGIANAEHRSSRIVRIATGIVLALSMTGTVHPAHAANLDWRADLRQNVLVMRWPTVIQGPASTERTFGLSETRMRGRVGMGHGDFSANAAVELRNGFTSAGGGMLREGGLFMAGGLLEQWNLTRNFVDESSASMSARIERMDIAWYHDRWTVHAGRQPLSIGTSHFVGVLDVIAPFAPGDLDATYKPGVDAIRIRRGIGMAGEAELIAVGDREIENGAVLGRGRVSWHGVDIEVVAGRFRHRGFGGVGWEGEIMSAGIWGEAAFFQRRPEVEQRRAGWSKAAFSGVMGAEFSVADNTILGIASMYQDFGARHPRDLPSVMTDAPFREGWAFLGSAAYGVLTLSRQMHPLVQGNLAGIINAVDGSTLWQPQITISTGDTTDLAFYGWVATGRQSSGSGLSGTVRSEFGQTPNGGGAYARWFF